MEKNSPINTKNHARFNKQKEQLTESLLPLIEKIYIIDTTLIYVHTLSQDIQHLLTQKGILVLNHLFLSLYGKI